MIRPTMRTSISVVKRASQSNAAAAVEVLQGKCASTLIEIAQRLHVRCAWNLSQNRNGLISESRFQISGRYDRMQTAVRCAIRGNRERGGVRRAHRKNAFGDGSIGGDCEWRTAHQTCDGFLRITAAFFNPF